MLLYPCLFISYYNNEGVGGRGMFIPLFTCETEVLNVYSSSHQSTFDVSVLIVVVLLNTSRI